MNGTAPPPLAPSPPDGPVRGRYAPSPTGRLHLGNLRTALLAWLQVRLHHGTLVLRMEDLDQPRVKEGSAAQILHDLAWLGLDWDEGPDVGGPHGPYTQSERTASYRAALEALKRAGRVFPCFCSRKDIQEAVGAPHGKTPVYPGTCRTRAAAGEDAPRQGRHAAWRFQVAPGTVRFTDCLMGPQAQDLVEEVGDFVLRRADRLFAYQLAVVVDDAAMGITDVLRGADLLDSSARQIALFQALGGGVPRFWHVPLMLDAHGNRLAKRDGSDSLADLQDAGHDAAAVIGLLASGLGFVPPGSRLSARDLLQELDAARFRACLQTVG